MKITLKRMTLAVAGATMLTMYGCGGGGGSSDPINPTPPELTALELATRFLTTADAAWATAVPATGTAYSQFADGCYLNGGYSKALNISSFDADRYKIVGNKYRVGSTFSNLQVLADRTSTNSDGSSRRELDIQYHVNYADGSINSSARQTLITGSSAGSIMADGNVCSTPQADNTWRIFGDRRIVFAGLRAVNTRNERFSLANGSPFVTNPVVYSKYIQFRIQDPANVAKYAVVTGPGLPTAGVKMLSPRLLRNDTLLAGKQGNYVDWQDTDNFSFCRSVSGGVSADDADCITYGARGTGRGTDELASPADVDAQFSTSFVAGGSYTVAIYNDDGWKTVNGQASQTPIKTYTRTLTSLPYSAAALAGTGVDNDLYPRFTSSTLNSVQVATSIRNKTSFTTDLSWTALGLLPGAAKFGWGSLYFFEQGRTSAESWPRSRQEWNVFPDAGVLSANLTVPAPSSNMLNPTYGEIGIALDDRNNSRIISLVTFN